jgi:hypothetical protein
MAWKHNGRTIQVGKAWVADDNTKHPRGWVRWDSDRKEAMGLVWEDDPTPLGPFDNFYYYGWNSDGDALLPKPLADLKTAKINQAKQTSASLLKNTDWYVTRKSETNTAIPSGITAYRTAVRANYTVLKTAIGNASDIAGLQACYTYTATSADPATIQIDATSSSVVSTSDNTITSNGHGFVNDEQLSYRADFNSDGENAAVIGGLVDGATYYVISTTTNTFKLSESHSNCGDAAVVSLTGLSSDGTSQTFTSQGKPSAGQTFPDSRMPKYGA